MSKSNFQNQPGLQPSVERPARSEAVLPSSDDLKGMRLLYSYLVAGSERALSRVGDVVLPRSVAESKAFKILYSFTGLTLPGYRAAGKLEIEQNPKELPSMVYNTRLPRVWEEKKIDDDETAG